MSEKKPSVLEGAAPGVTRNGREHDETEAPSPPLCALLSPVSPPGSPGASTPEAPPEDESADPVGDGHSDADWAARHPRDGG